MYLETWSLIALLVLVAIVGSFFAFAYVQVDTSHTHWRNLKAELVKLSKRKSTLRSKWRVFKEDRRRYRWVRSHTKNGDGLASIYAKQDVSSAGERVKEYVAFQGGGVKDVEIFCWMPVHALNYLSDNSTTVTITKGDSLYKTGSSSDHFAILLSGLMSFQVEQRGEDSYKRDQVRFTAGDQVSGMCQLLALVTQHKLQFDGTLVADEDSTLILVTWETCLKPLFEKFIGLREELLLRLLIRMHRVSLLSLYRLTGQTTLMHAPQHTPSCVVAISAKYDTNLAVNYLANHLGMEPKTLIAAHDLFEFVTMEGQAQILSNDPALYVVMEGELNLVTGLDEENYRVAFTYTASNVFGHLPLLTGSYADWFCQTSKHNKTANLLWITTSPGKKTVLAKISQHNHLALTEKVPEIIYNTARMTVQYLTPSIKVLDLATQWKQVKSGEEIENGCLYLVLNGRLAEDNSVGVQFRKGSLIGEMSFLTGLPSDATIRALRHSCVAAIPKTALMFLIAQHPEVVFHLSRTIFRQQQTFKSSESWGMSKRVVTIVPSSHHAPIEYLIEQTRATISNMGLSVSIINSTNMQELIYERKLGVNGVAPYSSLEEMYMLLWLGGIEESHDVVILVADSFASAWSKTCMHTCDLILYVADASDSSHESALEKELSKLKSSARKELVLMHTVFESENIHEMPIDTSEWISNRQGIHHHHHLRCFPDRKMPDGGSYDTFHFKSDFRRLGRWIVGRSVGVVLGGGGARGLAHMSVLRALEESGVAVDFVAGTSMGAFMGANYAYHTDTLNFYRKLQMFCNEMSSTMNKLFDLTIPVTSYMSGDLFNSLLVKAFSNTKIEDLWLPYFCMTTDLTDSCEIAHRNGTLWRYVRASMSLVNFFPPICDQLPGEDHVHLLADGGYMNNLPVDVMRRLLGDDATIIAVDVQGAYKFPNFNFGDSLSGFWYILQILNPFVTAPNIPTAADIQTQLAYISSVKQGSTKAQSTTESSYGKTFGIPHATSTLNLRRHVDLYLYPPVDSITTLQFHKRNEIEKISYEYAKVEVLQWLENMKKNDMSTYRVLYPPQTNSNRIVYTLN